MNADPRGLFSQCRFGLFVHWGLYAIPGFHEQHQFRLHVPRAEYGKLIHQFNPKHFNPDAWIDLAEQAGMKYLTFTTKHQDGFCLWHTRQTDFHVGNSPYGRDILAQLAEACSRRGFPLCLYYSLVDNRHPNYPNQGRGHELAAPVAGDRPDVHQYVEYVREQARELCTQYGPIAAFWWDVNDMKHHDPSVNEMIRSLQPGILINDRGLSEGDFGTPERDWDHTVEEELSFAKRTEACDSVGVESWGWRSNEDYHTVQYLCQRIDTVLAKGGNFLLNVGPMADGSMPEIGKRILRQIGDWFKRVRESLIDVEPASAMTENRKIALTRRGNVLYAHLNTYPTNNRVLLPPITQVPVEAVLLNDGSPVAVQVELLPSRCWPTQYPPVLRLSGLPMEQACQGTLVVKMRFDSL